MVHVIFIHSRRDMIAHIINAHMKHDASNHDNSRVRVPLSGVLNSMPKCDSIYAFVRS
jgi:hypothetical protein